MNWGRYIEQEVGDQKTFTAEEVRKKLRRALEYECDSWTTKRR